MTDLILKKVSSFRWFSTFRLSFWILLVLTLPAVVFYFNLAPSLALGTSIVSVLIILFSTELMSVRSSKVNFGKLTGNVVMAALTLLVIYHLVIASTIEDVDFLRAMSSLVLLVLVFKAAFGASRYVRGVEDSTVHAAVQLTFVLMCGIALMAVAGFHVPSENASLKPVFPFSEPSHFALSFLPLVMYSSVTGSLYTRIISLVIAVFLAVSLENLTLVVGCLLVILVSLRLQAVLIFGAFLVPIVWRMDISYYTDRLVFSGTENLSTLVYLQGWQLIEESLNRSIGWGLGFQQLGLAEPNSIAANKIFEMTNSYMNQKDGGFMLAKIVSEFGVVGFFLVVAFLIIAFTAFIKLRKVARNDSKVDSVMIISCCFVVSYLVELFIRGAGYFTPTTLMMLSSVFILSNISKS